MGELTVIGNDIKMPQGSDYEALGLRFIEALAGFGYQKTDLSPTQQIRGINIYTIHEFHSLISPEQANLDLMIKPPPMDGMNGFLSTGIGMYQNISLTDLEKEALGWEYAAVKELMKEIEPGIEFKPRSYT